MAPDLPFLFLAAGALFGQADAPPSMPAGLPGTISLAAWKAGPLPFYFKYHGQESSGLLPGWSKTEDTVAAPDGQLHRYTYRDLATHLKIVAEVRTFRHFDAIDWVLKFTNEGTVDTPILENIQPLHEAVACDSLTAVLHCAQGSDQKVTDFSPLASPLPAPGAVLIGAGSGRSSDYSNPPDGDNGGAFPFFNLQMGDHGLLGAIGWTGRWDAHFKRDASGKKIDLDAGLDRTHLLLHPGEMIRTPRILLMNWKGDLADAQNTWRQLMIADYSPQDTTGKTVTMPICWGTWGTERASRKLAVIKGLGEQKIPADLYWIDAGWYEPLTVPPGKDTDGGSEWAGWRGDWIVSKSIYPNGLRPLGDALQAEGIGFLLWIEAETANGRSHRLHQHRDWYLLPAGKTIDNANAYLNLGKPAALRWITDLVSGMVTDDELTWYRQDFNFEPAVYWDAADTPDRIGMSETKSIMGLYAFWDELRARHPGLQIDNCASGGRRLDIETMSRSVSLWRSDHAGDPIGEQYHTVGLMPWVPLTEGVWTTSQASPPPGSAAQLYEQRSAYCAGLCTGFDVDPAPWMKTAFDEFREVRPYFLGDFYSLLPPTTDDSAWAAWQLQNLDRKSGLLVCLRRPGSLHPTMQLDLHAIDPQAPYDVEVRTGLEKGAAQEMTGRDLAHFQATISDQPGSALIFYNQR